MTAPKGDGLNNDEGSGELIVFIVGAIITLMLSTILFPFFLRAYYTPPVKGIMQVAVDQYATFGTLNPARYSAIPGYDIEQSLKDSLSTISLVREVKSVECGVYTYDPTNPLKFVLEDRPVKAGETVGCSADLGMRGWYSEGFFPWVADLLGGDYSTFVTQASTGGVNENIL